MTQILVVEDDPDVRETLASAFNLTSPWIATGVSCVEEAFALVERQRPDAAIVDATLPRHSGIGLARDFVELGIPTLIMSGDPVHQQHLSECGCPFLAKPFPLDRLIVETRALLEQSAAANTMLRQGLARLAENLAELVDTRQRTRERREQSHADRAPRQSAEKPQDKDD